MATESDWERLKEHLRGCMHGHEISLEIVARLESEHKRVVSERDSWRERAHLMQIERDDARSTTQAFRLEMGMALGMDAAQRAKGEHRVVAERLRADSERLAGALRGLLLSRDVAWDGNGLGHDWDEAVKSAVEALEHKP